MQACRKLAGTGGLILAGLGLTLAGCAGPASPPITDFASGTPNPIQISRTRLVHEITFPPGAASADPSQLSTLYGFIAANSVGPADTVMVERGPGSMDQARAETLAANLDRAGLHPTVIADARVPAGVARVVVERYVAIAPHCPDWSARPGPNYQNDDQRNFGCADATNLAAMVADPKDLAMGATLGAQVGDPATRPVMAYRTGHVAKLPGGGASSGASGTGSGSGSPDAGAGGGSSMGSGSPGTTGP